MHPSIINWGLGLGGMCIVPVASCRPWANQNRQSAFPESLGVAEEGPMWCREGSGPMVLRVTDEDLMGWSVVSTAERGSPDLQPRRGQTQLQE